MKQQRTPLRAALVALVLLAQVSVSVAGLCAGADCGMTPPAGAIAAPCCCDTECDGIIAADTALVPVEKQTASTHGTAAETRISLLSITSASVIAAPAMQGPQRRPDFFRLYQSFRL